MSQITALISGTNQNYDYQLTALARTIINPGVISGLAVTSGSVGTGEANILCTRTNGQQVMVHYINTASVSVTTSGTTKIWVGISQSVIDDGSANAVDGTGIATIQTGASYPVTGAYIPLASITSGVITDARTLITGKPILQKGLTPNTVKEVDGSGNEVLRPITAGSSVPGTSLAQWIDPTTREVLEVPYSALKNDLSYAGKYLVTGMLGEKLDGIITSAIPNLGANADSSGNTASGSSILNATYDFWKAFAGSTGWLPGGANGSSQYVTLQNPYPKIFTGFQLSGYYWQTGWVIEASNDNITYTVLYTGSVSLGAPTAIPLTQFSNTTPYLYYRFRGLMNNAAGNVTILGLNFQQQLQSSEPIPCALVTGSTQFNMTLGSNIAGARVNSGIKFSVPIDTTLGVVQVSQVATSANARVNLLDSAGTLINSKTPSVSSNQVNFAGQTLVAGQIYKLVMNDSTYFGANNNELSLASYQALFQYTISGTLNGVDTGITPQAITQINIGSKKVMRTTAVSANEYAVLGGFLNFPKAQGDIVLLNANNALLVSGFVFNSSWVMQKLYLSNILGQLSPVAGTSSRQVGLAVSQSELYISSTFYPGTTITAP